MNEKGLIKIHLIISGRVQKIGFRNFVRNTAQQLLLSGWVKNLSTNQVEIIAIGKNIQINKFISKIEVGTFLSEIEKISVVSKESISSSPISSRFEKRETA